MPKNGEHFMFPTADGKVKLSGRDQVIRKSTSIQDLPARGEEHKDDLRGESDGSQPSDMPADDSGAQHDFWTIATKYIYRHHVEPSVELYVPEEESFPIPLQYIGAVRRTNATLNVLLEIDDYWNVVGDGDLSEPWTGCTQLIILNAKHPDRYTWSGGRLTKNQATRSCMGRDLVWNVKKQVNKETNSSGLLENRSSTMLKS